MLESIQRAYKSSLFNNNDCVCPVSLEDIETYLQILKPAYLVSNGFQKNDCSISTVIPSIQRLICMWSRMELPIEKKRLCKLLVITVKTKFSFELNSDVYKVNQV